MSDLDASQQAEASARAYRRADYVRLELPNGDLAYTTHDRPRTISSVTYVPGVLLGVSGVRVSADRKAQRIAINLAAADSAIRSAFEGDVHFSRMTYSVAFLDSDGAEITGLIQVCVALVSSPVLYVSNGSATLLVNCESETARFLRPRRVIAGDADQQWRFAGDKGLELVPRVPRSQAEWGGKMQSPGGGGGRSGGTGSVNVAVTMNLH